MVAALHSPQLPPPGKAAFASARRRTSSNSACASHSASTAVAASRSLATSASLPSSSSRLSSSGAAAQYSSPSLGLSSPPLIRPNAGELLGSPSSRAAPSVASRAGEPPSSALLPTSLAADPAAAAPGRSWLSISPFQHCFIVSRVSRTAWSSPPRVPAASSACRRIALTSAPTPAGSRRAAIARSVPRRPARMSSSSASIRSNALSRPASHGPAPCVPTMAAPQRHVVHRPLVAPPRTWACSSQSVQRAPHRGQARTPARPSAVATTSSSALLPLPLSLHAGCSHTRHALGGSGAADG